MRRIILFLLLFGMSLNAAFSQNKIERQLSQIEQQRFDAMENKDLDFLKKVLAEEVTYGHSNGLIETRESHLENIASATIVYEEMELLEITVRSYRKVAVINGLLKVKGKYRGTEFNIRLRYMDVYKKQKGKWKLVAWQSVKAED